MKSFLWNVAFFVLYLLTYTGNRFVEFVVVVVTLVFIALSIMAIVLGLIAITSDSDTSNVKGSRWWDFVFTIACCAILYDNGHTVLSTVFAVCTIVLFIIIQTCAQKDAKHAK